ncbi:cobalt ECF transporter T component CbiQ [Pseudoroseomonas wenyumeiae]|uniref:Cobalt ECF transporter T component CbiQ n=1 Tax=Teichococcus wenyumeiae TaxID=2478470 RepID=A0A3A9JI00_9PROT|nr:cobalt ECF transporter T component CbiQ [Pseudoroseomonas wenyumeiae]RKK06182.1 cobalt ECF transporter T component CbiQ [Pseudoroseomonas wenyumeiae]RMI17523.1 cobalt ECF transporter T component CbiQ [Pseudoroseomonas wenyumeiae]
MTLPRDLRLRIVAAFAVVGCLSQLRSLPVAAGALAAVMLLAWLHRSGQPSWRRLLHLEGFLLLLFVTLPFSVAGQPLFSLGPVVASFEGVSRAALIVCKVSASMLVIVTMLREDEPVRLAVALRGLHVPEPAVRLFMLTARYLELIRGEAQRLHDAMRMRGFRPRGNRHTWRSYGNLLGMLLVRALARAQRVEEAMLCRGYDGRFPRVAQPPPAPRDWMGFALILAFGFAVILTDRL